jgi:amidase
MVERLRRAGAIFIGRTNTPEFGLGSHTYNEVHGATRNAYDQTRSASGSSGGAAVALALRMLPVADGGDYGGSLRNPAGWNNVFALRPSFGRVPSSRAPGCPRWARFGPMARNVPIWRCFVSAGYDARRCRFDGARTRPALDRESGRASRSGDFNGSCPSKRAR